jgi:hypothetical protein
VEFTVLAWLLSILGCQNRIFLEGDSKSLAQMHHRFPPEQQCRQLCRSERQNRGLLAPRICFSRLHNPAVFAFGMCILENVECADFVAYIFWGI